MWNHTNNWDPESVLQQINGNHLWSDTEDRNPQESQGHTPEFTCLFISKTHIFITGSAFRLWRWDLRWHTLPKLFGELLHIKVRFHGGCSYEWQQGRIWGNIWHLMEGAHWSELWFGQAEFHRQKYRITLVHWAQRFLKTKATVYGMHS